jgi:Fe-S cluster assembly scaffold protein SufB
VLTHETSIGRLAEDKINYLQAKGFNEAVSLLVRGFITTSIDTCRNKQGDTSNK